MPEYFVRVGSLAEVHSATATQALIRGQRVILRTGRGVELGEVIAPCVAPEGSLNNANEDFDGIHRVRVTRPTTEQDELLIRRLEKHKRRAMERCRQALLDAGSQSILLDIDQLFDGATIVMHFLGKVDDQAELVASEIAKEYESIVGIQKLARQITDGCGPDCGTGDAACGTSCGSCSLANACKTTQKLAN